jgi:hypothetical protein
MGLLTPIAVKLGSRPWMPKLLPQVTWTDTHLQKATGGRVTLLDIAGLPNLMLTVKGRKSGVPRSTPLLCVPWKGGWLIAGSYFGAPKRRGPRTSAPPRPPRSATTVVRRPAGGAS